MLLPRWLSPCRRVRASVLHAGASKQGSAGFPRQEVFPAVFDVFGSVVIEVATLAEEGKVFVSAVRFVVLVARSAVRIICTEVRGRADHANHLVIIYHVARSITLCQRRHHPGRVIVGNVYLNRCMPLPLFIPEELGMIGDTAPLATVTCTGANAFSDRLPIGWIFTAFPGHDYFPIAFCTASTGSQISPI